MKKFVLLTSIIILTTIFSCVQVNKKSEQKGDFDESIQGDRKLI